jgi:tRNA (Thr-GGU) A37 N-methylase
MTKPAGTRSILIEKEHRVTVRRIAKGRLLIGPIEAIDGTPVVDIKPVLGGSEDF